MTNLVDIKDSSPNDDLVKKLEGLLEDARSGDLRSIICASGWADDANNCCWVIDKRSSMRRMLAELVLLESDLIVIIKISENDSPLSEMFNSTD